MIRRLRNLADNHETSRFFNQFKLRRVQKKLTQAELAQKMDVGQSMIANFESGKANPTLSFLQKMAKALDAEFKLTF